MTFAKYCKDRGQNLAEFRQSQDSLKATAQLIKKLTSKLIAVDSGMYYETEKYINFNGSELKPFIIQELKKIGVEFRDNNTLFRI